MTKTIRRRRLERKTDYKSRFGLLKSDSPRLVVRKSNKYLLAQIVSSDVAQDKILYAFNSKQLLSKGWPEESSGSLKSLVAGYLTGLALAKISKDKVKSLVFDMGMYRNVKKSRIFAVLAGAVAGGLNIPHSKDVLPSEEEILKNDKIAKIFKQLKEKI